MKNIENILTKKDITKRDFFEIVSKIDKSYSPPLSSFINNFSMYIEKLFKLADIYIICSENKTKGFCALYTNNQIDKIAYLTQIAINKEDTGKGYGNLLLDICENIAREKGMEKILLEVRKDNYNAIKFYEKKQFKLLKKASKITWYYQKIL